MFCCALIIVIILVFMSPVLILLIMAAMVARRINSIKGNYESSGAVLTKGAALALEYPYRKLFMSEERLMRAFELIKEYDLKLVHADYNIINIPQLGPEQLLYGGEQTLCELDPADYQSMNWISDWFNEKCRLACKRYDEEQSPLEYWSKYKSNIIDSVAKRGALTYEKLSDALYDKVLGCNNFRPGLMSGFIKFLGAKSVLDFSAGWGDRLIGAIAAGVRYVGVDPNSCVHMGYEKIIERFARDANNYKMIKAPFETAELPPETYDLVFTSPPYFDLEIYSTEDTQSTSNFAKLDDWFNNFLMLSLRKAWAVLNNGGHMVIIINNIRGKPDFTMRMISEVCTFGFAKYLGAISYAEKSVRGYKSPQPMWLWKKYWSASALISSVGARNFSSVAIEARFISNGAQDEFMRDHPGALIDAEWDSVPIGGWLISSENLHRKSDSVWYGIVAGDPIKYIWNKCRIDPNPKIILSEAAHEGKKFTVVRDDLLPGGTKQRAHNIVNQYTENEVVYAGPWNGFAQVALAIACKLHGKVATIFMSRDDYWTNIRAKMYGANIKTALVQGVQGVHGVHGASLKELQSGAQAYARTANAHLLEFGFDSAEFKQELYARIVEAGSALDREFDGAVWMVAGSATLLNVLYKVFPKAQLKSFRSARRSGTIR
jgi:hypothetical protein